MIAIIIAMIIMMVMVIMMVIYLDLKIYIFHFQVELKRLEDLSESIVQDFAHMRQREVRLLCRQQQIYPQIPRNPPDPI